MRHESDYSLLTIRAKLVPTHILQEAVDDKRYDTEDTKNNQNAKQNSGTTGQEHKQRYYEQKSARQTSYKCDNTRGR